MKLLVILCIFALAFADPRETQFNEWMSQYNKVYANDEEYDNRFQTFINNADKVKGLNNNPHNVTFELNNFADWTSEEFATNLLGYIPSFESYVAEPLDNAPLSTAPSAFDWCQQGKCTPIKNQEQCGSCWAFATTENIESVHAIAGLGLPDLAPQQIVDCDRSASGCNGGDPAQAYRYVVSQGGLDNEKSYPYVGVQGGCRFHANDVGAKIKGEKNGYGGSENQMAANLADTAPFSIVVDAQQWQFYKSGVFKASQCGTSLDHAVVAVGYNIAEKYWRVRNSWSASWGESGFIRLEFGTNTCGMRSQVLTAVN